MTYESFNTIYGFENYHVYHCPNYLIDGHSTWFYGFYNYGNVSDSTILFNVGLNTKLSLDQYNQVFFSKRLCTDHKELLDSATKVYVHPACKLSRTMLSSKYGKVLDPWSADAVVIPGEWKSHYFYGDDDTALFINEDKQEIFIIFIGKDTKKRIGDMPVGTKFGSLLTMPDDKFNDITPLTLEDIKAAELMYRGPIFGIPHSHDYVVELLTGTLPADKIVFEETIQNELGDDTNQITAENLKSIGEMIGSTEQNTISAGLKSLSMMDWMHYPNCIKFMMDEISHAFIYNKACNSTSVKYMLRTIYGTSNRRRWWANYSNDIYKQDYELFRRIFAIKYQLTEDEINNRIRNFPFMTVTKDGLLIPNIKV